jgi:uncharacterized membrane protein
VIIPGQREMVRAKREGREPSPGIGARGKLRSVHNTYFTLPVLFTMISNHYALTFGAPRNWLVLIAISAAGVLIRVYFVARHKRHERGGHASPWTAVLGLLILGATATALAPGPFPGFGADTGARANAGPDSGAAARFEAVRQVVAARCIPCHSATPTQPGFTAPPEGLRLDTPAALVAHATMMAPMVASRAMPPGNLTGMTDAERALLLDWIRHGAAH